MVFVKRDCPTCIVVEPVLADIAARAGLTVVTQDDPGFPDTVEARLDDTNLHVSYTHDIETVPTLVRVADGKEVARTVGWSRPDWQDLADLDGLGGDLPDFRPGCGSLSVDPAHVDRLRVDHEGDRLSARSLHVVGDGGRGRGHVRPRLE